MDTTARTCVLFCCLVSENLWFVIDIEFLSPQEGPHLCPSPATRKQGSTVLGHCTTRHHYISAFGKITRWVFTKAAVALCSSTSALHSLAWHQTLLCCATLPHTGLQSNAALHRTAWNCAMLCCTVVLKHRPGMRQHRICVLSGPDCRAVTEAKNEVMERKKDLDLTKEKMDKLVDKLYLGRQATSADRCWTYHNESLCCAKCCLL